MQRHLESVYPSQNTKTASHLTPRSGSVQLLYVTSLPLMGCQTLIVRTWAGNASNLPAMLLSHIACLSQVPIRKYGVIVVGTSAW